MKTTDLTLEVTGSGATTIEAKDGGVPLSG